ncbi:hypothetical protein ACI65C_013637 [Semiaphis heraclei]
MTENRKEQRMQWRKSKRQKPKIQVPSSSSGIATKELVTDLISPNTLQDTSVQMHFRGDLEMSGIDVLNDYESVPVLQDIPVQVPSSSSDIATKELVTDLISPNTLQDTSVQMHFRGDLEISGIGVLNDYESVPVLQDIPVQVPTSSNGTTKGLHVVHKSHRNVLLKDIDIYSYRDLTPNCKKLYYKAMKLKKKSDRLLRNKNKFKSRVKLAEKFAKSYTNHNNMQNKLNTTTLAFFHSQIKSQTVKPRDRRFSLQDKILSLSILKNSPKAYRFLSTIFALPSKKTLTNLLNHITFEAGINDHIIKNLTHQATRLKPNDRLCSLVFDEMAIEPATAYNI